MSAAQLFPGVRAKIRRARDHIADLEMYATTSGIASLVPTQAGPNEIVWVVRLKSDPIDDMSTRTGDAVHNLRASLDLLAVRLIELNGGNTKGVYFPFCDVPGDLDAMIKKKNFHRAAPEAIDVLRRLAPYRGGNAALRGLHDLDIADKHHDLIEVSGAVAQQIPMMIGGNLLTNNMFPMSDGARAIGHQGTFAAVLRPLPLSLVARFGKDQPFGGGEVIPTLKSLASNVDSAVDAFAALYGG